jgi:hypothetical protein
MERQKFRSLDIARLRELFAYDPCTGLITNRITRGNATAGAIASTERADGYRRIRVDGVYVKSHNLAWALHFGQWPSAILDHINRVKSDDRIENLRESTYSANAHNKAHIKNMTGHPGAFPSKRRFRSRIVVNGVRHSLGSFRTAEEASAAYVEAKRKLATP